MIHPSSLLSCTNWVWRAFEEAPLHSFPVPGHRPVVYKGSQEFFSKTARSTIRELSHIRSSCFGLTWGRISITVVFSFATIITFFAVRTPHAPFRFTMIHPTAAIVNIMACRVFRNIKLGRYSQDIPLPAYIEGGNATQQDSKPIINGENSYHSGEMSAPKSMEFSQRKDSWRFPITGSRRLGMETPSTRFGGVEVTKVIELVRD